MPDEQPPPHECQYCGRDLTVEPHKLTCRIVADIENIPGYLDIPSRLDRRLKKVGVFD